MELKNLLTKFVSDLEKYKIGFLMEPTSGTSFEMRFMGRGDGKMKYRAPNSRNMRSWSYMFLSDMRRFEVINIECRRRIVSPSLLKIKVG